jgi:hypothetical protein
LAIGCSGWRWLQFFDDFAYTRARSFLIEALRFDHGT